MSSDRDILTRAAAAIESCRPLPAAELAEAGEALARVVAAPDLAGRPVYVAPSSMLPPAMMSQHVGGYTYPSLCHVLRPHLGERWRGTGPACVIDDNLLREAHGDAVVASWLGITIHELAHAALRMKAVLNAPAVSEADVPVFSAFVLAVSSSQDADYRDPNSTQHITEVMRDYLRHEPVTWFRLALHYRHRAQRAGVAIPVNRLVGPHAHYTPFGYAQLLGEELDNMLSATAREIVTAPVPDGYARAARRDEDEFFATLGKSVTASQTAA